MGLKLHNPRLKNKYFMQLSLNPMAEIKTCVASVGCGAVTSEAVFLAFNYFAVPIVGVATAAIAFLVAVDNVSESMSKRYLGKGEVSMKKLKHPKIET